MNTGQEEFPEASLSGIQKEMAMPRMAQSARQGMSNHNRRPNRRTMSRMEALPKISFDLAGVITLKASFRVGETIFSQGASAETLMYIQIGRVKLSVASKTGKKTPSPFWASEFW
jgi:hypothetical protein